LTTLQRQRERGRWWSCRAAAVRVVAYRMVEWQGVSWNDVDACHWTWNQVRAKGIDLVECKLTDLKLSQCTMTKLSVLLSNLCRSTWQQTTLSSAVLSYGSSLEHAHLTDCVFRSSSFQDLQALGVQVNHCSFIKFNGQHLKAERSNWTSTFTRRREHQCIACLAGASFDGCSLKEATSLRRTCARPGCTIAI